MDRTKRAGKDPSRIRDDGVQAVDVLPMVEDEEQAKAKHCHDVGSQRQKEEEEVAVVPPADAVVYPRTVVVEVLPRSDSHVSETMHNATYVKQKKSVVEPTRKKVAADTGT
ncbi:hypothetical protein EYF80_039243 [Liparis tanakae]|uniref:Uncharacterized protein n=1 Tax=Liparis tanakae TaxID=230148 RepID=A0A4Z2GBF5_9TELE|nr:hypothetical protein EYF80_039243 [Liparis tanakae]